MHQKSPFFCEQLYHAPWQWVVSVARIISYSLFVNNIILSTMSARFMGRRTPHREWYIQGSSISHTNFVGIAILVALAVGFFLVMKKKRRSH